MAEIDENENIPKNNGKQVNKSVTESFQDNIGVSFLTYSFLVLGPTFLFFLFVVPFLTEVWWPTVLYMSWWLWDLPVCNEGGRADYITAWVRRWRLYKYFARYFPIKLVKTVDLSPQKNYLFCSHPHGVLCYGVIGAIGSEGAGFSDLFPGIQAKLITLEGSFWLPGMRELLLGVGGCSSSKKSLHYLLSRKKGVAPVLMVGGIPEISNYDKDKIVLVIKKRKGFVKLALQNGAHLVPVFSFGETEIFYQPKGINSFLDKYVASWIGFYPVIFSGRGYFQNWFGIMPRKKEINVVVGKPISVPKLENPTPQDVEQYHERYISEVEDLYNENKSIYGYQDVKLEIV